jgi:ring-1,2-phenylacetyl-CoA epoxidase subunit PaaD
MVKTTKNTTTPSVEEQKIWQILREVKDPEIPVLSIVDLGILRAVHYSQSTIGESFPTEQKGQVEITITPTYSGCPAMDVIRMDIRLKLLEHGYKHITIQQSLSPAWTTDWITEEGRRQLKQFGIAPPNPKQQFCTSDMFKEEAVQCPYCNSYHTKQISRFGSTACKAVYQCNNCKENFDYFKCH